MEMNVFSNFRGSKLCYGILAIAALFMTATTTHAGFEWVPADPKASPPVPVEALPTTPPAQDLLMHEPQPLSPLPPLDMEEPKKAAMPKIERQPQPVIKIKKMTPLPAPEQSEAEHKPVTAETLMDTEALKLPPTTHVIMPEDAPNSARTVPEAEILEINPSPKPLPDGGDNTLPIMPLADALAPTESIQDAVGFGTDIPLALALQQIAPAGYAFSFGKDINPGAKVSWTGGKAWTEVLRDMIAPLALQASVRGKAILIHHEKQSAAVLPPADMIIVEPSSGDETAIEPPIALEQESMPKIRRNTIKDPGAAAQEQPQEALSTIERLPPTETVMFEPRLAAAQASVWEAEKGDSLKQTLSKWSKKGGFEMEWRAVHDYTLTSDILVGGSFDKALKTLLVNGVDVQKGPSLTYVNDSKKPSSAKLIIEDRKDSAS